MTLQQGIELAQLAKAKGYVLAADNGLVQAQVLDDDGEVEQEITGWLSYQEANAFLNK